MSQLLLNGVVSEHKRFTSVYAVVSTGVATGVATGVDVCYYEASKEELASLKIKSNLNRYSQHDEKERNTATGLTGIGKQRRRMVVKASFDEAVYLLHLPHRLRAEVFGDSQSSDKLTLATRLDTLSIVVGVVVNMMGKKEIPLLGLLGFENERTEWLLK
ncbi:hypothetical protein BD770DRAFT_445273 [Pilaira anomala]|nr:hypothetical protein BD770DRAFT_445273 [Pilaira anomala]